MAPWGPRKSPVPRHTRQKPPRGKTAYRMQPKNWRGKVTNTLKKSGDLCIYRCVPPTHEYGTRPFLRWDRSQGRNPDASGKAKNTFGPVGIPLLGAPQPPINKPNPPEGGISLGDGPLRPEEISSAEAHPAEPSRGKAAYRMQPKNWRGKVTDTLKKSGDLWIFAAWNLFIWKKGNSTSVAPCG